MSATEPSRMYLAKQARAARDAGDVEERDRLLAEAKAGLSQWSLAALAPYLPESGTP